MEIGLHYIHITRYVEVEVKVPSILTSKLHGGKWLASHPNHLDFIPGKAARYTLYRRLGGYQVRSGRCGNENYFLHPPGIEPQFLGRRHHPHRTHDLRSCSQDHHPSKNSVQKTICCNSTSNAPDDRCMYPKHVELRIHQ